MATGSPTENQHDVILIGDSDDDDSSRRTRLQKKRVTERSPEDLSDRILDSSNSRRPKRAATHTNYAELDQASPSKHSDRDDDAGPSTRKSSRNPRQRTRQTSSASLSSSTKTRQSASVTPQKRKREETVESTASAASRNRTGRKRNAPRINAEAAPVNSQAEPAARVRDSVAEGDKSKETCMLCKRSGADRDLYFRMEKLSAEDDKVLFAHYLCMFTASNLHQREDPRAKVPGTVCGFSIKSVEEECQRARRLRCKYCGKHGAAVGCNIKKCPMTYHYPCGVERDCYFNFNGSFESYCPAHIPFKLFYRPADLSIVNRECVVCLDEPDLKDRMNSLITTCCNRAMHRSCLGPCFVNAGKHHIKCPACNDTDTFRRFCDDVGIHVPNADATWLAEEIAREEAEDRQLDDPVCAAAGSCLCPNGLSFDEDVQGRAWNLEHCAGACGTLMHAGCMKSKGQRGRDLRSFCEECFKLDAKVEAALGRREGPVIEDSPEIPERPPVRTRRQVQQSRR